MVKSNEILVSHDVPSLVTNVTVPLNETIEILVNIALRTIGSMQHTITSKRTHQRPTVLVKINGALCEQTDGVAMGSLWSSNPY